jgi:hypothetical protein
MTQYGYAGTVATMAIDSGTTLSSEIDLGKPWNLLSLRVPTMTSGTNIFIQGAGTTGGNFDRIYTAAGDSAGDTTPEAWEVDSATCQAIVPFAKPPTRYIKIELSTAMTASSAIFEVICSD